MKVLVLGASGGVGSHLVRKAAEAGHEVTALARSDVPTGPRVRFVRGDVLQEGVIADACAGQDAVLSALGIKRKNQASPFSPLTSPPDFTTRTARMIVAGMRQHGVQRVIAVSASGVGDSRPGLNWMVRGFVRYTNIGFNYRDLEDMERVYAESGLDWCCVRPTGLTDRAPTGQVKQVDAFRFGMWIPKGDVAGWMVDHLTGDLTGLRTPSISGGR